MKLFPKINTLLPDKVYLKRSFLVICNAILLPNFPFYAKVTMMKNKLEKISLSVTKNWNIIFCVFPLWEK